MTKVYVVLSDSCDCCEVLGVFSTRELADEAIANQSYSSPIACMPEEVEVDTTDMLIDPDHVIGEVYRAIVRIGDMYLMPEQDGDVSCRARHPLLACVQGPIRINGHGPYDWFQALSPISREHAEAVAVECAKEWRESHPAKS